MRYLSRKDIIAEFEKLPKSKQERTFSAWAVTKYLMVLWNLERNEDVPLTTNEKKHYLLVYKYLGLVWFDNLDAKSISVYILGSIPHIVTPDSLLETYALSAIKLNKLCANIEPPAWIKYYKTTKMTVSLDE